MLVRTKRRLAAAVQKAILRRALGELLICRYEVKGHVLLLCTINNVHPACKTKDVVLYSSLVLELVNRTQTQHSMQCGSSAVCLVLAIAYSTDIPIPIHPQL